VAASSGTMALALSSTSQHHSLYCPGVIRHICSHVLIPAQIEAVLSRQTCLESRSPFAPALPRPVTRLHTFFLPPSSLQRTAVARTSSSC
jgi:hypothetical protein